MEKDKNITVRAASEILGISPATVKNWIKLGKLKGTRKGASFLLSEKDVRSMSLSLNDSDLLRKRRNKSRQDNNFFPKSYINNHSANASVIKHLIETDELKDTDITAIIGYYAKNLMEGAGIPKDISGTLLSDFKKAPPPVKSILKAFTLTYIPMEDTLGMLYLCLRSLHEKKSTGAYYTPYFVVDKLIEEALSDTDINDLSSKSIADPSCGTGNFLLRLPEYIPLSNVFGYDIDPLAVDIARVNMAIKYRIQTNEELNTILSCIKVFDFLLGNLGKRPLFDIVIGNPPWGYSYNKDEIALIKKTFSSYDQTGKPESFSLFIEKAMQHSQVTFLLPETLLGSDYHQSIRDYIYEHSDVLSISYLGEVFDNVQCPSVILRLAKKDVKTDIKTSFYKKKAGKNPELLLLRSFNVSNNRIQNNSFHILADDAEYQVITKMQSTPHFTLEGNADFALGIVTGDNKNLLSDHQTKGAEPIVKGRDISKYKIEKASAYTVFAPDKYQQVAPECFYRAKDKLFYRFIASEPVIALDNSGMLSLNSANILIPRVEGYTSAYIMAILNSDAISFYYRHSCKNLKVLRSALESLPIPVCSKALMEEISALSLSIQASYEKSEKIDQNMLKKLDNYVAKLYNLNTNDLDIIRNR